MKPAPFAYVAPSTVEEALRALRRGGDEAKPLAGGQSLVPLMNFRFAQLDLLVDLNGIPELAFIRDLDGGLGIGAMTRTRALERSLLVAARCPLISQAVSLVGHPQIRNRGTFGGSLAHADPAAELPTVVVALEATMVARALDSERVISARDFFVTHLTTALAPDELLTEIRIPELPRRAGTAFLELSRRHGDFAIVGTAVVLTLDEGGRCERVRIVLSGVAPRPLDVSETAASLVGDAVTHTTAHQVAGAVARLVEPSSDIHASGDYRRRVAGVLVGRALLEAAKSVQEMP